MPTKLLIDLSMLRHPHCGLGQIALNYGRWAPYILSQLSAHIPNIQLTLLVPRSHLGSFGSQVSYVEAKPLLRSFPFLFSQYDLWHSIHQLSPFRPTHATPRLLTIHDLNFLYEKEGAKRQRYLRRLQSECNASSAITFISQYAQSDALQHLDLSGKPLQIIYNGVEDLTTGPIDPPQGIDPSRPFFLCMGVLKPKKNLHLLLPAMQHLPAYDLVIAGNDSDPYARHLRTLIPSTGNVRIIGPVSDPARRWLYAHCTALLFPSQCEGFGLPLIEAMQWGKPVFASRYTSLPEIGADLAFYFPPLDTPEPQRSSLIASTILNSLPLFTPQRAEAERQHAASFSYKKHIDNYIQLYLTLLDSSKTHS